MRKIALLLACCVALFATEAAAQTVRFDTNVGSFNVVLNPTNNPDLQDHVNNFLGYVALGRYHFAAIHRDPDIDTNPDPDPNEVNNEDFVLQMGGFSGFPGSTDAFDQLFPAIARFDPVIVDEDNNGTVDFVTAGLSNTAGTVTLALGGGDPNSGTSDFFINLRDNSQDILDENDDPVFNNLDDQNFIPFAEIESLASLAPILGLEHIDLRNQVNSPVFGDVPVVNENEFVVIQDVVIVEAPDDFSLVDAIQRALGIEETLADSITSTTSSVSAASADTSAATSVPEPTSLLLMLTAATGFATSRRRR